MKESPRNRNQPAQSTNIGVPDGSRSRRVLTPSSPIQILKPAVSALSLEDEGLTFSEHLRFGRHLQAVVFSPPIPIFVAGEQVPCFHSPWLPGFLRTTTRHVPPEATDVSFFFLYESVVDTPRLFGVKSASYLVVGGSCGWLPCDSISVIRLCLSLLIGFASFYPSRGR
jgi:hypothetical protein